MKKVLFIGDLRSADNYGAVATSEAMINIIGSIERPFDVKYIDYRSLYYPTPPNGFLSYVKSNNLSLKRKIVRCMPLSMKKSIKKILGFLKGKRSAQDYYPYKYNQYEDYYSSMMNGSIMQYEKKMLEWADIVIINGEGNIVHGTDSNGKYRMGARYILFMAWMAKTKYNLPTLMVNHTVDPDNCNAFEMIEHIYPLLDKVFVREKLSIGILEKHGVTNVEFVPDALFTFSPDFNNWQPSGYLCDKIDFSKPYICLGDSSGFKNAYSSVPWNVPTVLNELVKALKGICPQIVFVSGNTEMEYVDKMGIAGVNIDNCPYEDLIQILHRATLFISGRWHASILSCIAKTPILLWGSDSHKTRSLYPLMEYKYRFFEVSTLPVNIPELVEEAKRIIADGENIKKTFSQKVSEYSVLERRNGEILKGYV